MKFRSTLLMTVLLALLCAGPLTSAEASAPAVMDTTIYDLSTNADEGRTYIRYTGDIDMSTDSVGTFYTQAMLIGNANQGTAIIRSIASDIAGQTEDVNVTLEVSADATNWTAVSTLVHDSLNTTAEYVDLSALDADMFKGSPWARLKIEGQTGNPSTTVSFDIYLLKNSGAPGNGAAIVRDRGT